MYLKFNYLSYPCFFFFSFLLFLPLLLTNISFSSFLSFSFFNISRMRGTREIWRSLFYYSPLRKHHEYFLCTHIVKHAYTCLHTHARIHTYVHTHTHIYIHAYARTHLTTLYFSCFSTRSEYLRYFSRRSFVTRQRFITVIGARAYSS